MFTAVDAGFDYVDLDLETRDLASVQEKFRREDAKIILSTHNYSTTPSRPELNAIIGKMASNKPDILKVVTTANNPADNLTVLSTLEDHHEPIPLVCLAMGRLGLWSRILAPFHGAPFTYASLGPGRETASGQPSISALRQ